MTDLDLIDLIYQAALDPDRWSLVAPALAAAFGCENVQVSVCPAHGPPHRLSSTGDYAPPLDADYAAYFRRYGRAAASTAPAPDDITAFAAHYADEIRDAGSFHCMGLPPQPGHEAVTAIGVHCRRNHPQRDELPRLRRIQRHIARAVRMSEPAGARDRCGHDVLEQLPFAILVVTGGLELRIANRAGYAIVAGPDGAIRRCGERIDIVDPRLRARLEPAIHEAIRNAASEDIVLGEANAAPAQRVEVRPIRTRFGGLPGEVPAALLCIHPAEPVSDEGLHPFRRALRADHRLTRAESDVALAIMRGQTVAGYAEARRISVSTVRTQLRQIFAKTGCRRQADLVRLLYPTARAG